MTTLVIGMGRELTRAEAERVKEIALEMLPEGTRVLVVAGCTALEVVP